MKDSYLAEYSVLFSESTKKDFQFEGYDEWIMWFSPLPRG